ncbi:hypothetical protein OJF2_75920 [Aquisphaera giovannonii]|uniref:Uncharacterized protein n=1 Tax=Aquisphaera giovannonii TaxID=406548 RepID=A0A5B9WGL1_9BACT|nr:hypothetical protein [Aquisphaera giovannonii]QEH38980.1 hypothetical protein OJF2_75920 [Aquisphaera giovannonii]
MFIFHRSRRQPVEIFDILIHEEGLPDAEERFGPALRWGRREERFHEVGHAILIHDELQTEYFLMAKEGLSEEDLGTLDVELLQLIGEGQDVQTFGYGPMRGTFEHDIVQSPVYSRPIEEGEMMSADGNGEPAE